MWAILAAIAATLVLNAGLEAATGAVKGSKKEMMSIPAQQLVRVYLTHGDELTAEDYENYQYFFEEHAFGEYDPWLADSSKNYIRVDMIAHGTKKFLNMYLSLGQRYPQDYVAAFVVQNEPLWYLGTDAVLQPKGGYLEISFSQESVLEIAQDSKIPWLRDLMKVTFGQNGSYAMEVPLLSLLLHPAAYTWLLLGLLAHILEQKRYACLFLVLLPLGYYATLLLGPCILPRYCLGVMLCVPVLLAFMVHIRQQPGKRTAAEAPGMKLWA